MSTLKLKVGSKVPSAIYTDSEPGAPVCIVDTMGEIQGVDVNAGIARRMVACWNACAGISTDNLEDNLPIKELAHRYNAALRERDALLSALQLAEGVAQRVIAATGFDESQIADWRPPVRAAIDAATESQRDALLAVIKPLLEDYVEWVQSEKLATGSGQISRDEILATFPQAMAAVAAITSATESQRIAADLRRNAMKDSGELRRRDDDRALAEQIKWETPT